MNRFILVALVACSVVLPRVAHAQCMKWVAPRAPCDLLNVACNVASVDLTWPKNKAFFDLVHQESALEACKIAVKYTEYEADNLDVEIIDDYGYCLTDPSGIPTYPDDYHGTIVKYQVIERQACCSRVPAGPYSDGMPGTPGAEFTQTQRSNVKAANVQMYGALRSNVDFPIRPTRYFDDEPTWLSFDNYYYFIADDDASPYKLWNPYHAQVDHIVPRKDFKGCDCGSNSLANALVISAGLNNSMSNNCEDPNRIKILNEFAPL